MVLGLGHFLSCLSRWRISILGTAKEFSENQFQLPDLEEVPDRHCPTLYAGFSYLDPSES
jgi:hypothetical protein